MGGDLQQVPEVKLKPCRVCQEPIRERASKCIKCGSYQDWTRHLVRLSALAASLFALYQFSSIADSLSELAFVDKTARVEAAITHCGQDEVRLAFENSGEISGIVTAVDFALLIGGQKTVPDLDIRNNSAAEDILVSPGTEPVRANFQAFIDNTPASFLAETPLNQECRYLLDIHWIDFAGSEQVISKECPCP
jgi:hypothetical protein